VFRRGAYLYNTASDAFYGNDPHGELSQEAKEFGRPMTCR
jgi:hypothetical protein